MCRCVRFVADIKGGSIKPFMYCTTDTYISLLCFKNTFTNNFYSKKKKKVASANIIFQKTPSNCLVDLTKWSSFYCYDRQKKWQHHILTVYYWMSSYWMMGGRNNIWVGILEPTSNTGLLMFSLSSNLYLKDITHISLGQIDKMKGNWFTFDCLALLKPDHLH